jgi:hypothetical protein
MSEDGDLRMLGARDGLVTALLDVRNEIANLDGPYRKINPRHTSKIEQRDRDLAPLRRIERHLMSQIEAVKAAYEDSKTRELPPPRPVDAIGIPIPVDGRYDINWIKRYRGATGADLKSAINEHHRLCGV